MSIRDNVLPRYRLSVFERKKRINKQSNWVLTFFVVFLFISPMVAQAVIVPTPQISVYDSSQELLVDDSWQIVYDQNLESIDNTISVLNESLNINFGVSLETEEKEQFIANHTNISSYEDSNIFLMLYNDPLIEEYFISKGSQIYDYSVHIGDKGFNQGYLLFSYNGGIYVLANSSQGINYGVQSLKQIIETQQNPIDGFNIIDWPDIEYRIYYFVGHEDRSDVSDPTIGLDLLKDIAKYKMNGVQLSSGSMMSHMSNMFIPYVNYCIRNFIRPILAHSWPKNIEKGTEGFFVEDEPFTFNENDIAVADNSGDNILLNSDFEDGVIGSAPDNWYVAPSSWSITDQDYYSGSSSLTLSNDSSGGLSQPMVTQTGDIQPNSGHLATFKIKTEGSSGTGKYQFLLYNQDISGNLFYREINYTPIDDGQWHTIYLHVAKHPDARKIKLWIRPRNVYGTIYVDDIKLYRMNSELNNVLLQGGHIFKVTNQDGTIEYLKDVDYSLEKIGPDLTTLSSIRELTNKVIVKRIPSGSIDINESVLISYDYIFYQDKSTFINLNPFVNYTYDLIKDYMAGLANEFNNAGISSDEFDVFLGQDEIRGFNMDSRSIQAGKENYEAMAMNFNKLYSLAKEVFPNAEVFFWADMLNLYHNGGDENYQTVWGGKKGTTYQASNLIDKSSILIPWQYSVNDRIKDSVYFFNDAGIKIAGGAGGNIDNIKYWSAASKDNYFYGQSIFKAEYSKKEIIKHFANYSWNNYKPTVPTNLQGTTTSTSQINLTWGESTGGIEFQGYNVYRNGQKINTTIVIDTIYQDIGLSPSTSYVYTISAYDIFNNESQQSNSVSVTTEQEQQQVEETTIIGGTSLPGAVSLEGSTPETQIITDSEIATTTTDIVDNETSTSTEETIFVDEELERTATTSETPLETTTVSDSLSLTGQAHIFTKPLRKQQKNEEVTKLQQILRELGFFTYPTNTGYYGTITETAVKQFQCNNNIVCTGTPSTTGYGAFGPRTREKFNEVYGGTQGAVDSVVLTQEQIKQIEEEKLVEQLQSQVKQIRQQIINLLTRLSQLLLQNRSNNIDVR